MRLWAWANGLGFLIIGLGFAMFVEEAARGLGISFSNPTGLGDFRAVYGGIQIALGVSILFLTVRGAYREAVAIGLFAVTALAGMRIIGMVIDQSTSPLQWRLLAPEVIGVVANALVLLMGRMGASGTPSDD